MKKDDFVVRIWPSGIVTMGKAVYSTPLNGKTLMFYSLEHYGKEGGVNKDDTYGYIDNSANYIHRLATDIEIYIFEKKGYLGITEAEIISLYRDDMLKKLID